LLAIWCLGFGALGRRLFLIALLVLIPRAGWSAGGAIITLPQPGTKVKSGLIMTLDFRGVEANGYRPVRVEFRPLNGVPLPADRQVRVTIGPTSYNSSSTPVVSQVIDLPEGSTNTVGTLVIPQSGQWWMAEVEVREDGEVLRDLSVENIGFAGINYGDWTEARPTTLIIDSDVPDRRTRDGLVATMNARGVDPSPTYKLPEPRMISNLFPDPNRQGFYFPDQPQVSDATLLQQLATNYPRLELLPPAEVAERWVELSQYDLIIVSLADLEALAKNHPQRLRAIADWAAGGPVLIVYGVGENFARLAELEKLLAMHPLPDDPTAGAELRGWQPALAERHLPTLLSEIEDYEATSLAQRQPGRGAYVNPVPPQRIPAYQPGVRPDALPATGKTPFATRPLGLGIVVAATADNPFPGKETDWMWIFNSVPRNHWTWYQRNGYSLHRVNNDYWTFLIPGVGEAPVVSFLLLVSLFAVVIGPVNYMLLGKSGRYYLLLITVPLGAALMTAGLFAYALLTDGLGVKVRARSFTHIDQPSGRAAGWSRQSYYASIAPSRGLTFPEDTTVFPVIYQPNPYRGQKSGKRLEWDDDQHLTDGYISSRTTMQFMVLRSTESAARLNVSEGATPSTPPGVTNELGAKIAYVLVRDSRGSYWQGENLAPDAAGSLAAVTGEAAAERLRKLYTEHPPELPRGYDPSVHNNAMSLFMPNYGWYNVDMSSSLPVMASSLLEKNLASLNRPAELASGTYVAVTDTSAIVPYGVPRVQEEASLHVIRGRY
jgi:hypothetical protein